MAITITCDNYDGSCVYFTISGGTVSGVQIERSSDGGLTWVSDAGSSVSPRCGYTDPSYSKYRVRSIDDYSVVSNVFTTEYVEHTVTRTLINTPEQITFCNSPIHLRLQNDAQDSTIETATVYLWIWNGNQNKTLGSPNVTLVKSKVSQSDDYINFQVADLIKAYLVSPDNAPNTNQPNFVYNELTMPSITGQGVFWQIVADITSNGVTVTHNYNTNFATLGYRWNYEQNAIGDNGLSPNKSIVHASTAERWYNSKIHHYITQYFNLTNLVADANSVNMITRTEVTPDANYTRCTKDPYLIVFLNKLGLWDMFTPHGKVSVSTKTEAETTSRSYRDPAMIDNSYTHSKLKSNLDVTQSYTINTGLIDESGAQLVEEIIYSPKVYLIKFKGDVNLTSTVGITIDSTYITIDDTNITIDAGTVTGEYISKYKTHQQIPVIVTDTDFYRKTRLNDKVNIDYNIKFEETNNKILDIS